jgi:hypothetical protein
MHHIAIGGTAGAAIDLPDLSGAGKLRGKGVKTHTLVEYSGY